MVKFFLIVEYVEIDFFFMGIFLINIGSVLFWRCILLWGKQIDYRGQNVFVVLEYKIFYNKSFLVLKVFVYLKEFDVLYNF